MLEFIQLLGRELPRIAYPVRLREPGPTADDIIVIWAPPEALRVIQSEDRRILRSCLFSKAAAL